MNHYWQGGVRRVQPSKPHTSTAPIQAPPGAAGSSTGRSPMELKFKTPTGQTAAVPVKHYPGAYGLEDEYTVELTLTLLRQLLEQAGYTEMSQRLSEPA